MIDYRSDSNPRKFELGGFEMIDRGVIRFYPEKDRSNEIVAFETATGKKCEMSATNWGYYLGPSLNSRLPRSGFRAALTINEKSQVYLVAVDTDKLAEFEEYLRIQPNSRVLYWADEWLAGVVPPVK